MFLMHLFDTRSGAHIITCRRGMTGKNSFTSLTALAGINPPPLVEPLLCRGPAPEFPAEHSG